jgi:iron complex outermembrane receptor protein
VKLHKRSLSAGCALIALTWAAGAQAQTAGDLIDNADTSLTIGEVVVTASAAPQITNVLTSVDILGGSVAQRESINQTFELFQRLPGVLTTSFGQGNNNNGAISMRGFNGEGGINAVKLIIDGVPSNVNDGFGWMMDSVMPMDIAQVQVVRGTSDARYGMNNIAGNVNILTRQGGQYIDARLLAGTFNTYDGQAALGHESGAFSQNYFVGYNHTGGQRQHASSERVSASGKWYASLGSYKVGLDARYSDSHGPEPGYLTADDAKNNPNLSYPTSAFDKASRRIGQYSLHLDGQATDNLSTTSNLYFIDYHDSRFVKFAADIPQQERQAQQSQHGGVFTLHYTPTVSALHGLTIDAGADFQIQRNHYQRYRTIERVRQFQLLGQNFELNNYGAFVQAVIEPTAWLKITPAYRVDTFTGHFTDTLAKKTYPTNHYGAIHQPKISAAVTPLPGATVYANYGRTFQIGLGAATYLIPPQTVSVKPSYNDGWETGVKYRLGGVLEARAAVWRQVASGELQFDELDSSFRNLGKTRRTGYDLQVTLSPGGRVSGWAAFSHQKGVVVVPDPANAGERAGNRIDHVPDTLFSGGADFRATEKLRLSVTANGQSDYEIDTTNTHGKFGGYFVVNAEAAYQVTPHLEFSVQVKNIGDDRHAYVWWDGTETLHAPADGRSVYGVLRVRY